MQRMIQYFEHYCTVSREAGLFLGKHGRVTTFHKRSIYLLSDEIRRSWCFILDGFVGLEQQDQSGKTTIEQVLTANDYFNGSKHAFSTHTDQVVIRFYKSSTVYELSHAYFRQALDEFPELQHLYHILKQQQLNKARHFLRVNKIPRITRVAYLYQHFPHIAPYLTVKQHCSLLGYTTTRQYYAALEYYLRQS